MNRLAHSPFRKSLSYAVFALAIMLIGLALSVSAYADGLTCSDDNNDQTELAGCVYYVLDSVASTRTAERRAARSYSIEVQYYRVPIGTYNALEMPYYIRVVDHRRSRHQNQDVVIGHMNSHEYDNTVADLAMSYNNTYAAALTGHGDALGFQYMPSLPAFIPTVAGVSGLVVAMKALTNHEFLTGSTLFMRTLHAGGSRAYQALRRIARRGDTLRNNPAQIAAGVGLGSLFSLFIAYTIETQVYQFYKSAINERHWFEPASLYSAFLQEQVLLTQNCILSESYCPQLVIKAQANDVLAQVMASTDGGASVLEDIDAQLSGQQETRQIITAALSEVDPLPAGATVAHGTAIPVPETRPAIRVHRLQHVADSYAAFFREPCTGFSFSCRGNIGPDAGFRRPNRQVRPAGTRPRL